MHNPATRRIVLYGLWILSVLLAVALIVFLTLYFMPHHSSKLQQASTAKLSYQDAVQRFENNKKKELSTADFEKDCESQLLTHGKKVARSVVMFHGITACSKQYSALAKTFFDAGYNVYVPLAPLHGTTKNPEAIAGLTTEELTHYVGDSYSVAAALGDNVGLIGMSGGGVLATWGAQYIEGVSRLLVLSPFYIPSEQAAPRWQIPLMLSLYGMNLVPDRNNQGFSTRALAKYLIIKQNFRSNLTAQNIKHVAVVTSANDEQIDLNEAHSIPRSLAKNSGASFQQTRLAPELGIGHDIVGPYEANVTKNQAQLSDLYLSFYENRAPAKEL